LRVECRASAKKIFFSFSVLLEDNHGSTLNAEKLLSRLIRLRGIALLIVALFLLSGHRASADSMGDFFKKVGQSISKAFQPQPSPGPTKKNRASRRPIGRELVAAESQPSPLEEPPKSVKEEKPAPTVLPAAAVPVEKAKGDMPYGIPVPSRKGLVISPYLPEEKYIDVSAFLPGAAVRDPYTGKIFRVP
jgi:hypothetical protein